MTDTPISVTPEPIATPQPVDPLLTATAIVTTPTTVAPLTTADGTTYVVQVMIPGQGTVLPVNAASWSHDSNGDLDVYDASGNLVASWPGGQWTNVQLVTG